MQKLSLLLLVFFSLFIFTNSVEAKVLPQATKGGQKATNKNAAGSGINVTPKLRSDRRAITVYFSNLKNATSVSYLLRYKTNGQEEGAMGALSLKGSSTVSQELLFGTCSKNVCRYHTNITDARLEVPYTTQTGKKYLKRFKIKI